MSDAEKASSVGRRRPPVLTWPRRSTLRCLVYRDQKRSWVTRSNIAENAGFLCNETVGANVSLYGGEGNIRKMSVNGSAEKMAGWAIRFTNTPEEHGFAIMPIDAVSSHDVAVR